MTIQKWYCSVPCFYRWYRTVPFLYQLFSVYQKPAPIRYCPVPCLYRSSGTRYWYTVLEWYWNDVQNGTVRYLSDTVYRENGIGTVPVSNIQKNWNGTVQYGNVYWECLVAHDDVIKWKHFLRYWPFVRGIHRSLVNSPHKGQCRGTLMFFLSAPE